MLKDSNAGNVGNGGANPAEKPSMLRPRKNSVSNLRSPQENKPAAPAATKARHNNSENDALSAMVGQGSITAAATKVASGRRNSMQSTGDRPLIAELSDQRPVSRPESHESQRQTASRERLANVASRGLLSTGSAGSAARSAPSASRQDSLQSSRSNNSLGSTNAPAAQRRRSEVAAQAQTPVETPQAQKTQRPPRVRQEQPPSPQAEEPAPARQERKAPRARQEQPPAQQSLPASPQAETPAPQRSAKMPRENEKPRRRIEEKQEPAIEEPVARQEPVRQRKAAPVPPPEPEEEEEEDEDAEEYTPMEGVDGEEDDDYNEEPSEFPGRGDSPVLNNATSGGMPVDEFGDDNMQLFPCRTCGRSFNSNALTKHTRVCKKVFVQKRKAFDVVGSRKPDDGGQPPAVTKSSKEPKKVDNKWRKKSDAFRNAMKMSKQIEMAKKGKCKMPDFVPTPEDLDDRKPCPHCGRKFNDDVAARHIPKCKDTKSKPNRLKRGSGGLAVTKR